jgi:uncharacterized RDD family membrane protein YckC
MPPVFYPRLIRRIQAVLIDSVLVPIAVIGTLVLGDSFGVHDNYGKFVLAIVPIFVLEPGLVALTGGTVGHHVFKIRVAKIGGQGNINVLAATLRFIVKLLLGWLSFIFVLTTRRRQAVHDLIVGSVVVHKDASTLPAYEALPERAPDSADYVYPPRWRRVLVIASYWGLATIGFSILSGVVASDDCIQARRCGTWEFVWVLSLDIGLLLSLGWITVRGWSGLLYGCQRRARIAV